MTRNNPILLHLFGLIALLLVALALASCKSQSHFTDTTKMVYQNRVDSVYILQHDSIFIDRYTKGDTVFIDRFVEHTKWRDNNVIVHDTTYQTRTETQTIIQKKVPPWCWWLLGLVILVALIFIIAFILRLKGR